ncbi:MAG: sulfite exporter TauE/SafE family protein [Candidatus Hodarchaeota archaeon]
MDIVVFTGLITLGLAVGIVISLIGVSGSIFVIPILLLFYSTSIHAAIGTSLLIDMIGASIVTLSYFQKERVDLNTSLLLILSALIGSQLGVLVAVNTGEESLSSAVCFIFMGIGVITLFKGIRKTKNIETMTEPQKFILESNWLKRGIIVLLGLFIGLMSGIFGAGGGMMIIFVLLILFQYPPHTAIGTATAIMAIIALSGVIGYSIQGHINFEYGIIIGLGAIISGRLGSKFTNKMNEKSLLISMGCVFISVGLATFYLYVFL